MVLLFCRNTLKLRIELPRAYQNRTLRASVPVLTWTRASHLSGASGGRRETFLGDILHGVTLCDSSSNGRIELNPNNADINGDAWVPSGATRWSSLLWSHVLKMKWRTLAEVHVGQGPSHHRIRAEKNTCFFTRMFHGWSRTLRILWICCMHSRLYYHCGARDPYGNFKIKEHRDNNHSNNNCSWLYRTCVYQHYRHIVSAKSEDHAFDTENLPRNCRSKASSPAWLTPRASKSP